MSKLSTYTGVEAANLFLGQGGFDSMTGAVAVEPEAGVFKRWIGILILQEHNTADDIELYTEVGDDLVIDGSWVIDLVGTVIYGPFNKINPGSHDIIAYRG